MAKMVKVSLLQPQGFRETMDGPITRYPMGIVDMPLEHAEAMGLRDRILGNVIQAEDGTITASVLPFGGAFDEKLSAILTGAGYKSIEDLSRARQDELLSIEGIGPMAFERITHAVRGG